MKPFQAAVQEGLWSRNENNALFGINFLIYIDKLLLHMVTFEYKSFKKFRRDLL